MGCCNSKEDELPTRRQEAYCYPTTTASSTYNRRVIHDINIPCDNRTYNRQRNQQNISIPRQQTKEIADPTPKIGKYKCGACGRFWTSRYCWADKYQNCKRCKRPVYAYVTTELKASDKVQDNEDKQPHEIELCQMCQQLGYSCTTKKYKYNNKKRLMI